MPKNSPVQSCGALKLASYPGGPITKISKSVNMKNFDIIGSKSLTKNAKKLMPENRPAQSYEVLNLLSFLESLTTSKLRYYYLHHNAILIPPRKLLLKLPTKG